MPKSSGTKSGVHQAPTSGLEDAVFTFRSSKDAAVFEEVKSRIAMHFGVQSYRGVAGAQLAMETLKPPPNPVPVKPEKPDLSKCADEEARKLVAVYRARIYGPVSALVQLLPEDDEWAEEAREMFRLGRETLAKRAEISEDELEDARWHLVHPAVAEGEVLEGEESMLTWGIP